MRPIRIGITYDTPARLASAAAALAPFDVTVVPLSPRALRGQIDGLLLTGGRDIDPALYGEARHVETEPPDQARDALEMTMLADAATHTLPVLGLCRGMQLMNVFFGGALLQHVERPELHHHRYSDVDLCVVHPVTFVPETKLGRIAAVSRAITNSRHHQSVVTPGPGLTIAAVATDNTIEGLEHDGYPFMLGVQWHPEDRIGSSCVDRRIFDAFVVAARHAAG